MAKIGFNINTQADLSDCSNMDHAIPGTLPVLSWEKNGFNEIFLFWQII